MASKVSITRDDRPGTITAAPRTVDDYLYRAATGGFHITVTTTDGRTIDGIAKAYDLRDRTLTFDTPESVGADAITTIHMP